MSQVLCKTSMAFAIICKITMIAALDEDEGGSFDMVVG